MAFGISGRGYVLWSLRAGCLNVNRGMCQEAGGSVHNKGIHELCYTPDIIMTIVEAS